MIRKDASICGPWPVAFSSRMACSTCAARAAAGVLAAASSWWRAKCPGCSSPLFVVCAVAWPLVTCPPSSAWPCAAVVADMSCAVLPKDLPWPSAVRCAWTCPARSLALQPSSPSPESCRIMPEIRPESPAASAPVVFVGESAVADSVLTTKRPADCPPSARADDADAPSAVAPDDTPSCAAETPAPPCEPSAVVAGSVASCEDGCDERSALPANSGTGGASD